MRLPSWTALTLPSLSLIAFSSDFSLFYSIMLLDISSSSCLLWQNGNETPHECRNYYINAFTCEKPLFGLASTSLKLWILGRLLNKSLLSWDMNTLTQSTSTWEQFQPRVSSERTNLDSFSVDPASVGSWAAFDFTVYYSSWRLMIWAILLFNSAILASSSLIWF